jgi:hypothetical protein
VGSDFIALDYLSAVKDIGRFARKIMDFASNDIAQRRVFVFPARGREPVANQILFGQIFDNDRFFRHDHQLVL